MSAASAAPARKGRAQAASLHFTATGDNRQLAHLAGSLDENLRQIEAAFQVRIARRGHDFRIEGGADPRDRDAALAVVTALHALAARPISAREVQLQIAEHRRSHGAAGPGAGPASGLAPRVGRSTGAGAGTGEGPSAGHGAGHGAGQSPGTPTPVSAGEEVLLRTRGDPLRARTPRQLAYLRAMLAHDICFGIGPAGTGKTYLAVACAVDALERDAVERIILTRPAVEAGERLGFLPGDLAQKVDPYLRPLYDALYDLLGFDKTQRLLDRQTIEIAPLAYMRGRTLNHAFVILDEAQNTTPEQMKMFLTRIGFGSRAVITGDVTQTDLPRGSASGLIHVQSVLEGVEGIGFTRFTAEDVVRHPLVARIVAAYERAEKPAP